MEKKVIISDLNKILSNKNVSVKIDDKNINTNFKDLGADSLKMLEIIMDVEEKYSITLPDDELIKIKSANDLIDLIIKNVK